jgi:hypothetical protein
VGRVEYGEKHEILYFCKRVRNTYLSFGKKIVCVVKYCCVEEGNSTGVTVNVTNKIA